MDYKIDHCEPFDNKNENIWMKCEHVGRYLFAIDYFLNQPAKKILDVACAEGFGSYLLSQNGFNVFGADINSNYVKTAQERCSGFFAVVDFEKDDFPSNFQKLDGAVCFETIEHLKNGQTLLNKICKSLKNDGILILSFPNSAYEKLDENGINFDPYHLKIYTKQQMEEMVTLAGFEKVEEFGQSLCNMLYGAEIDAVNKGRLSNSQIDKMFKYGEESIINYSKLLGYPTKQHINESYSNIWILKKRNIKN